MLHSEYSATEPRTIYPPHCLTRDCFREQCRFTVDVLDFNLISELSGVMELYDLGAVAAVEYGRTSC